MVVLLAPLSERIGEVGATAFSFSRQRSSSCVGGLSSLLTSSRPRPRFLRSFAFPLPPPPQAHANAMPGNIVNLTPATIASWPTPNYRNPPTRNWMPIYASVWYGISTLLIALRLWLRVLKQAGGLGLDDYLLAFAWVGSSMFTTCLILSTTAYDADRHAWDIPLQNFEKIALLAWLAQFSWLVTGAATKISVLCFYRRLVAGTYSRRWKWAVIAAIVFTAGWTLAFLLMLVFNCNPTDEYWKAFDLEWRREYTCLDTTVVNLLAGVFAVASDVYAVALPCVMTRHFELPRRQKVALNLIFCMGLLVVAASGVRTYFMYRELMCTPSKGGRGGSLTRWNRSRLSIRRHLDDLRYSYCGPARAAAQHHLRRPACSTCLSPSLPR